MPSATIGKHAHMNWYEITLVSDGEGIILTNDIPIDVSKGDIYLSYPGDFHEIRSSADKPLKYDFFAFNTKNPKLKKELKNIVSTMYYYEQRIFKDELIHSTVSAAIAEISSKQEHYSDILCSLFEQTLFYLIRNFKISKNPHQRRHTNSSEELCFQIMNYIDSHITSIKSLTEVADNFLYNYTYLSDLFKNTTGRSIKEYFLTVKLKLAKDKLDTLKLTVTEIAELCNFSSVYSFSRTFKKHFGISPEKYRKIKQ
jgi:AraC-like DNA-binding protein